MKKYGGFLALAQCRLGIFIFLAEARARVALDQFRFGPSPHKWIG